MFKLSFLSVCALLLCGVYFAQATSGSYDVCVIGGGASGAASTVFLKQLGYSVRLIEKNDTLGGHCNTVNFPGPGGQTFWLDIGVQAYINTTNARLHGLGDWAIDTVQFMSQFIPASLIQPISGGSTSAQFNVDLLTGQLLPAGTINQTEFNIAIGTLLAIVNQYPWLNTGERPDPVPAFMLEPAADFIVQNNLQILVDSIWTGLIFYAGVGDLAHLSTLQALQYLSPLNLNLVFGAPNDAFALLGGCHVLYEGIAAYLGNSVTYSAHITEVDRESSPTTISGYTRTATGAKDHFQYSCGKTIVAFYPLLQNLEPWFDLSDEEACLFSKMEAQGYLAIATTFTDSPQTAGQALNINNLDPTQQYALPRLPNLSNFQRFLPFGPAGAWVNDQSSHTPASKLLDVAHRQLANMPASVLTNLQVSAWSLHQYAPHFNINAYAQSPTPDTVLSNLQGEQDTFWVGAGVVTEGSHAVWNQAYKLVRQYFPPK